MDMYPHPMEAHPDRELVTRAQQDPEAFGQIFDVYHVQILRYCIRRTGDVELGRDLAASTFFKAMNQLGRYRWQGIPLSAWLYRIATNEIASHYRTRRSASLDDLLEAGLEVPDAHDIRQELIEAQAELERHAQWQTVHTELQVLPHKYQEVIMLRFFEDKTLIEIAQILGKRHGTIKSLLSRGLAKLRERVQPSVPIPVVQMKAERLNSSDSL